MDDFHRSPQANLFANAIDLAGNGVQHRLQLPESGFGTGGHHRHLALGSLGGTTRNRGVQHAQTQGQQLLFDLFGIGRGNGGRHHHRRIWLQLRGQAVVTKQDLFHLRGVDHQQQQGIEFGCKVVCTGSRLFCSGLLQGGQRLRVKIDTVSSQSGINARLRRSHAH
ncbi:hypothetical protein D3C78_1237860 [compost metagenome]